MFRLPSLEDRAHSVAMLGTESTRLGQAIAPIARSHPGKSGFHPLSDGRDAFAARSLMADAAERCLDVQYYIWHADLSGRLLFDSLFRAAERGVRVRLLLDDNNTNGLDLVIATLDYHPNIEVRLFNPFVIRKWRALGYLTDFRRLNRRMHNKSFTVDNQVTIIGGRNICDEYFGSSDEMQFVDFDVMAIGPIVREVSADFDRYWACSSSYPADRLLPLPSRKQRVLTRRRLMRTSFHPDAARYGRALAKQAFVKELLSGKVEFEWTDIRMVSDDPAKGLGQSAPNTVPQRLKDALGTPRAHFFLVSAYFVPTAVGVQFLQRLSRAGVEITIVTNSLEATDVTAVHAGYAKHRRALLKAGIKLYEVKRVFSAPSTRDRGLVGHSGSSLHAKTFTVDATRTYIGSFNFDPRSALLNTEMGFVIESTTLAEGIATYLENGLRDQAYEVKKAASGRLKWIEFSPEGTREHTRDPYASTRRRLTVSLASLLPIEWLL